jgi:sulfite reductase (NADPH) flavoprotein alpha-component|uniref:FAD-binding FR-type domain-containing protein n=1 Tax=Globisporangium ultimum (strain ATCC 200006 / CBS 805.95 / DAOM BR144) TaxID=431595 RepID=K3X0T2_GLOUD
MQHPERQAEGLYASTSAPVVVLQTPVKDAALLVSAASLWSVHRRFPRAEAFTSGADAVLTVAGNVSENVFVYPLLDNGVEPNYDELRARVVTLEIRQGAASAVRGALAVGTSAAALVPSQTLPLFLPNLFQIAQSNKPAVFHVACEAIRQDLAVGSSYESVYALQHSGAILLNSANAQECHDLAVVAHVAALRLQKLVVHFYDGSRVARELAKINVLSQDSLKQVTTIESTTSTPIANDAGVAEQVQSVMDDLFHVLQKQYKVYEYSGAADAEYVIVVVGEAIAAIEQAVAYERMIGNKVGVLQVRLLLPWSHALFAAAIPATAKRVAVLENISTGSFAIQSRGLLTQNVQVFFHSQHWTGAVTPVVATGIYGGVYHNAGFSSGMGRSVFHHLRASVTRRSFVVAKSEALYEATFESSAATFPQLDVVYGDNFELEGADAYSKQFLFWGFDDEEAQTRGASLLESFTTTLDLLTKNPSTQVNALVNHSTPSAGAARPISTLEVRVSLNGGNSSAASGLQQAIEQADVNVVTKASLLKDYDIVSSVKHGGSLLVLADWKTVDDVDESAEFKAQLAKKAIQLLVVDLAELQTRVEDDAVAAIGIQVAFFKASGLFNENVVLALLQNQFASEHHATIRSFVSAVWGDTATIAYPVEEWKNLTSSVVEGEVAPALASLASLQPSKIAHSVANSSVKTASKRSRAAISNETKTAWKFTFPDTFGVHQDVRDHVEAIVKVTKWERLTPEDYSRNVFHVEMDIDNTPIKYAIGEALAVFAHNDEKDVLTFLRGFNVDPEALVSIPVVVKGKKSAGAAPQEETLTYFQLFSQVLDIFGRPSKKFYQALLDLATDDKEKETLALLLDAEGKDEFKRRVDETTTFAELLEEFKSARPTIDQLIQLVPHIKARHYSIASSMKMNPKSVHLLIVVHDWTTPSGKYRIGQATNFLQHVRPGQMLSVHVCSSVMKLPVNPADPIIMAGLGTGMAPFRAFIQERAFLKAQGVKVGPVALYFGSRSKAQEYLYGDELDQYEREGLVTYLRCAFSRDQPHKVYIQDKIAEDKEILADLLLNKNGHFYLCGPTWPVADVREALITSFTSVGGLNRKQANAYIERMREEGRYVLEVY